MKPPPVGPASGPSVTNATNAAAMQASTALPPSASTDAPASAVAGCPAAIAPGTAFRPVSGAEEARQLAVAVARGASPRLIGGEGRRDAPAPDAADAGGDHR